MSEEEKKIKEMEELGIRLIDSPSETVAKASPTKLKLQALTFMVIGKIERYFLNNMLKQAKEARNLAEVGLKNADMTLDDKMAFKKYLDSNITLLEEKMALFDKNYKRVIGRGKRSLKLPSANFVILAANMVVKKRRQDTMVDMIDSYKQMNDVFSTAKTEFVGMPKPIKRDIEISKVEQEGIKKAVYQALSGMPDGKAEDYASKLDDKVDARLDSIIRKDKSRNKDKSKEQELDNFFENISPVKEQTKLTTNELSQVLNGGKAKETDKTKTLATKDLDAVLNSGNPIFSNSPSIFEGKSSVINSEESVNRTDLEDTKNSEMTQQNSFVEDIKLADDTLADFAGRLGVKKTLENYDFDITNGENVPDVDDLKRQLEESAREREQKRIAKEEARKKYETEKLAREKEEKELSDSKKEIEKMKEDIKRKREEQEAIDKLNQRVKKALEYQKQIEENKRAALEEEEEARKYQETLRIEKESQTKMAVEKEKVQSERVALQSENTEADSDLKEKKAMLQEFRKQLQEFGKNNEKIIPEFYGYAEPKTIDIQKNDFFSTPISGRR